MGILDEDIERVRNEVNIVDVIGERVALKRSGSNHAGLCPFHSENSPSFSVTLDKGLWYCFGCHRGGDAIKFVRDIDGLDFTEAVERLAARYHIQLRYDSAIVGHDRQRRDRLVAVNQAAVEFYLEQLLETPAARHARDHLRARGFDGTVARRFSLGYAPDDWDRLSHHLQQQRFARDDIVAAGLAFVNKVNKLQDFFRNRLMFPIFDVRGEPIGFGGRDLVGDGPKYRNTSETPLYRKSQVLYGLNWARADIVAKGEVIVCEGYTDVMACALAGADRAVATCGTALADEHFTALKNFARTIIVAYDADAAGQAAAERFYRWEQQYDVRLKVAALPAGRDPAEVWKDSPAALIEALDRARPFLEFRINRIVAGTDLSDTESCVKAQHAVAQALASHPSRDVRVQYVSDMWRELTRLRFDDPNDLRRLVERYASGELRADRPDRTDRADSSVRGGGGRHGEPGRPGMPTPRRFRPPDRVEVEALRAAVHFPELVAHRLEPGLFADPVCLEILDALLDSATLNAALDRLPDEAGTTLNRIAVEEPLIVGGMADDRAPDAHDDAHTVHGVHDVDDQPSQGVATTSGATSSGSPTRRHRPGSPFADARARLDRSRRSGVDHRHASEIYVTQTLGSLAEAAANRMLRVLERAADERGTALKLVLDDLVTARANGEWTTADEAVDRLVGLLMTLTTSGTSEATAPAMPEAARGSAPDDDDAFA